MARTRKAKPWAPAMKFLISSDVASARFNVDSSTSIVVQNFTPQHELPLVKCGHTASISPERVCGSWIWLLPTLMAAARRHHTNVLSLSVQTLSAAIIGERASDIGSLALGLNLYGDALRSLHDMLQGHRDSSHDTVILASSMCLALTEVRRNL